MQNTKNHKKTAGRSGRSSHRNEEVFLLSKGAPFAVAEAYKTLRTNLMFTMRGKGCHVIEVTSPVQGEGKSTTAINLAITLADAGARVALVDCDLRVPTDAMKLGVGADFGLSNILAGMQNWQDAMIYCEQSFDLLSAGEVPPNPAELLSSREMAELIQTMRGYYDYIILDAPPVTVVTDAVLLSRLADGVLMVVRHEASDRELINKAVHTLEFANAKIVGFVYTNAQSSSLKKYKYYGYGYGYAYSNSYAEQHKK